MISWVFSFLTVPLCTTGVVVGTCSAATGWALVNLPYKNTTPRLVKIVDTVLLGCVVLSARFAMLVLFLRNLLVGFSDTHLDIGVGMDPSDEDYIRTMANAVTRWCNQPQRSHGDAMYSITGSLGSRLVSLNDYLSAHYSRAIGYTARLVVEDAITSGMNTRTFREAKKIIKQSVERTKRHLRREAKRTAEIKEFAAAFDGNDERERDNSGYTANEGCTNQNYISHEEKGAEHAEAHETGADDDDDLGSMSFALKATHK